jgi:predicted ATPase
MTPKLLLERYRVGDPIGQGRLGTVYRGLDVATGQAVAIKHLRPDLIERDPHRLAQFEHESALLGQLNHPNIVKLHASLRDGQDHYLVVEFLEGGDLRGVLRAEGRLSLPRALRLGIEVADALTRAHHIDIVHRDVSPANIMLTRDGAPKLTDFGLTQLDTRKRITRTEANPDAPHYMSPELLNGESLDPRADIWSLGIVLYELLTGQTPFATDSLAATILRIANAPTPDLEALAPDAPPALVDLIYRMLEKEREARISSARRVGAELEQILYAHESGRNTPLPRRWVSVPSGLDTPAPMEAVTAAHNLPPQATPFIGRARELAEVTALLRDPSIRLLTLLGAGGIGKTRLALASAEQVAAQFAEGAYFVALAPLTTPSALVQTLGHTLGMDFTQDIDPQAQLLDYLRGRNLLLVLDNWEHLPSGLPILLEILQTAQSVKVLATSRVKLSLQGETVYTLDGLDYPDRPDAKAAETGAVELFVQAARRALPVYELTPDQLPDVVTLCQIVEGMPLGIELAASWVSVISVREIVHEMRSNLDFLATDATGILDRQRSLRAVFEYSWHLLSEEERAAFGRMAVFRGRFTRAAGQAVTGASIRQMMALANKSLLRRDADSGAYYLHEVSRQFAEEKLEQTGEAEQVRDAHAQHYLQTMARVRRDLEGRRQLDVLDEIESDLDNFRVGWLWAARRGLTDDINAAAYGFSLYFLLRGELMAGADLFTDTARMLRVRPTSPERDRAYGVALTWQAVLMVLSARDPRTALPVFQQARQLILPETDPFHHAVLLFAQAFLEIANGNPALARDLFAQIADSFERLQEPYQQAMVYANWSRTHWYRLPPEQADLTTALRLLDDAQTALGDDPGLYAYAYILTNRAMVESMLGIGQAEAHAREALSMYRRLRNMFGVTSVLNSLTIIAVRGQRLDDARRYAAEHLRVRRDIGGEVGIVSALLGAARVEMAAGAEQRAREYIAEAGRAARTLGSVRYQLEVLVMFAQSEAEHAEAESAVRMASFVRDAAQADPHQRERAAAIVERMRLWLDERTLQAIDDQSRDQRLDALISTVVMA